MRFFIIYSDRKRKFYYITQCHRKDCSSGVYYDEYFLFLCHKKRAIPGLSLRMHCQPFSPNRNIHTSAASNLLSVTENKRLVDISV